MKITSRSQKACPKCGSYSLYNADKDGVRVIHCIECEHEELSRKGRGAKAGAR